MSKRRSPWPSSAPSTRTVGPPASTPSCTTVRCSTTNATGPASTRGPSPVAISTSYFCLPAHRPTYRVAVPTRHTFVAFLAGVNVGGHRVSMPALRHEFEALGYSHVSTFIASGNVVFTASARPPALERAIEAQLGTALGYDVPTFVRTPTELAEITIAAPFRSVPGGSTHLVGFLRDTPPAATVRAIEALSNDVDRFVVQGKHLHWLVRGGGQMMSNVKRGVLVRTVGRPDPKR